MTITSLSNDKVRLARALQARRRVRRRESSFVVEGFRLCDELARAQAAPRFVLYTQPAAEDARGSALLSAWTGAGVPCYEVSEAVMTACSETETPQGLLAVVPIPRLPQPERPTLVLVLDRLRDPGNLGTILRAALAAGVELVLLTPGTVDALNPKVVRAAAGAHFRLPVVATGWEGIAQGVAGRPVYLAAAAGGRPYTEVNWREPLALIVGGEATGAGERAWALTDEAVSIPMASGVESLNAAIAAALLLFEAARQRRGS
jgi:TrmH family RNA methyltransferase